MRDRTSATHNEWMVKREQDMFANVPKDQMVHASAEDDIGRALRQSAGGQFSFDVSAGEGLYAEYTSTPGHQLIHLVNFQVEQPVKDVKLSMAIPQGKKVKRVRLASPDQKQDQTIRFTKPGTTCRVRLKPSCPGLRCRPWSRRKWPATRR